jgi:hypothetical protein
LTPPNENRKIRKERKAVYMAFGVSDFSRSLEEAVKADFRNGMWPTYERYEVRESDENLLAWEGYDVWADEKKMPHVCLTEGEDDPGLAYVRVANDSYGSVYSYRPLVDTPALFLEFARLADEEITREVWLDWVQRYGVLGLGLHDPRKASSMDTRVCEIGGHGETYRNFVREACKANWLLKLFEYARSPEEPGEGRDCPTRFQVQGYDEWYEPLMEPEASDPAELKRWALGTVLFEVNLSLRQSFPVVYPSNGGQQSALGWDFYSLLGAMYLQMAWLINAKGEEVRWCKMPGCTNVISFEPPEQGAPAGMEKNNRSMGYHTRKDKEFCSDRCRGRYHYYYRRKPSRQSESSSNWRLSGQQ